MTMSESSSSSSNDTPVEPRDSDDVQNDLLNKEEVLDLDSIILCRSEVMTVEYLTQAIAKFPHILPVMIKNDVLHSYVGIAADCPDVGGRRNEDWPARKIDVEVVEYLLELMPDAVHKPNNPNGISAARHGGGALPLHLACLNADCPTSVIRLLLEKNPSAIEEVWDKDLLPLHYYVGRARVFPAWYEERTFGDVSLEVITSPALPTGDVHYETVKLLVDAYPEALTFNLERSALSILCEGTQISSELANLLIDKDATVLDVKGRESPLWTLLHNTDVNPFPGDVFEQLFDLDASSLQIERPKKRPCIFDSVDSCLSLACENKNMTVGVIELLVNLSPEMVMAEDEHSGCLPLHTLCKNFCLDELSAVDILNALVQAYPESLKKKAGEAECTDCLIATMMAEVKGKRAINIAEEKMSLGFCKALLSHCGRHIHSRNKTINNLQLACQYQCSLDLIKRIVEDDHSLLLKEDVTNRIALHTAARFASVEVIKYLVEKDESTLLKQDAYLELPLHQALRAERVRAVKYLVSQNRASLLIGDIQGRIPLHVALKYSPLAVVKSLVDEDESTLTTRDNNGEVALHYACHAQCTEVVEYLMNQNMSAITMKNKLGQLPVHILCTGSGISIGITESIFKLLRAHPETMMVKHDK